MKESNISFNRDDEKEINKGTTMKESKISYDHDDEKEINRLRRSWCQPMNQDFN